MIKKILHKNKENNDAINTVIANKQQLEDDAVLQQKKLSCSNTWNLAAENQR